MNNSFAELGLNEHILRGVEAMGYENPTPVQKEAIPHILQQKDVVAIAQTGTGKTAAFMLPALQLTQDLKINKRNRGPYVLVISPTRELAQQAGKVVEQVQEFTGQRSIVVTGGARFGPQINACQRGAHVLVATPGRLKDLMDRNVVHLNQVEVLVLDEADRMLDMGFWKEIQQIIKLLPQTHQTLLFSATMPKVIESTVKSLLKDPAHVEIARSGDTSSNVEQHLCPIAFSQKTSLLIDLLKDKKPRRAIVFCRTKRRVDLVNEQLRKNRFRTAPMHSDCPQKKRERALDKFRKGNLEVLVATDVLARGIDVANVDLVINYDTPLDPEDYVHRIGRTGRAEAKGVAYTFMCPEEVQQLRDIEYFIKDVLPQYDMKNFAYNDQRIVLPEDRTFEKPAKKSSRSGRRGPRKRYGSRKPGARNRRYGRSR